MQTDYPAELSNSCDFSDSSTFNSRKSDVMRSAVISSPETIDVRQVPIPLPKDDEVRVRLEGCGICASNMPVREGRPWFYYPLEPGAPGHEGWGRIDAVGDSVTGLHAGDRVAILSSHAFAQYDTARADSVIPLPPELDDHPFPGEPLGCAMNIFKRCNIAPGQWVAVIGAGFLGALLTDLATQAGARVIAVSRRPYALEVARRCGAMHTVLLEDERQTIKLIRKITNDKLCERVIEATGYQQGIDIATEVARVRGQLIIAGFHQDGFRQVDMQKWNWQGLDVINAHERDPKTYVQGIREAVRAVTRGRLNVLPLLTHSFGIEQLADGFGSVKNRDEGFLKAYVTF